MANLLFLHTHERSFAEKQRFQAICDSVAPFIFGSLARSTKDNAQGEMFVLRCRFFSV